MFVMREEWESVLTKELEGVDIFVMFFFLIKILKLWYGLTEDENRNKNGHF